MTQSNNSGLEDLLDLIFDKIPDHHLKIQFREKVTKSIQNHYLGLLPEKKKLPGPVKQELFSEQGPTFITSPDVFGEREVSGFNQAVDQMAKNIREKL